MQRITTEAAKAGRTAVVAQVLAVCGVACALGWAPGAQASPDINVLALSNSNAPAELMAGSGGMFVGFDHASASPGGSLVVVGRVMDATGAGGDQTIWARPIHGQWRMVLHLGAVNIEGTSGAIVTSILAPPIINDAGQVLVPADVVLASGADNPAPAPALLRIAADGTTRLLLRFNTESAAGQIGVPVGLPDGTIVPFGDSFSDAYRFTNAGAYYACQMGLLSDCGGGGMSFLTAVSGFFTTTSNGDGDGDGVGTLQGTTGRGGRGNPHPNGAGQEGVGIGTAVVVGVARNTIALSASGHGFQHVNMSGYTQDALSGLLMFDPMGLPSFAVRDGTTPIADLPGQFILTTAEPDLAPRVGMNSACTLVFTGRYGIPPDSADFPTVGENPPSPGPLALFVKKRWSSANLIAQIDEGALASVLGAAPGFPGFRFISFSSPVVNSRESAVFGAELAGPGVTRSSIWMVDLGGQPRPIAVVGVPRGVTYDAGAPAGQDGAVYTMLRSEPMLNARGQVSFFAQIREPMPTGGTRVVDALCGYDPLTGPSILARSNEFVTLPGVGERILMLPIPTEIGSRPMTSSGNDDGAATTLTNDGLIIFRANVLGLGRIVATARIETPTGACCAGSTCGVQARLDCIGASHRFVGVGTVCTSSSTASCCPADFDQSGAVGVQDLLGFIQAWTTGSAMTDLSGDGRVAIPDLLDFLQVYLGGCG